MGMLFNTPATLDILQKLNTFYGASNFNILRANAGHYSNWPPFRRHLCVCVYVGYCAERWRSQSTKLADMAGSA